MWSHLTNGSMISDHIKCLKLYSHCLIVLFKYILLLHRVNSLKIFAHRALIENVLTHRSCDSVGLRLKPSYVSAKVSCVGSLDGVDETGAGIPRLSGYHSVPALIRRVTVSGWISGASSSTVCSLFVVRGPSNGQIWVVEVVPTG